MADQRPERRDDLAVVKGFDSEQNQVNRTDLGRFVGGIYLDHKFASRPDQFQSIGPDGF